MCYQYVLVVIVLRFWTYIEFVIFTSAGKLRDIYMFQYGISLHLPPSKSAETQSWYHIGLRSVKSSRKNRNCGTEVNLLKGSHVTDSVHDTESDSFRVEVDTII